MKKVLIISYHAPPREVTTAYRIGGLIEHLPKFGWQPIVCSGVLPAPSYYKMLGLNPEQNLMAQIAQLKTKLGIYSEKSWIDKLIGIYAELTCYPDPMKKWQHTLMAQEDYDLEQPDLVMSHSFPHTSHLVAAQLQRKVPWIASFSDLWTQSHFYPYSRFRKKREEELEVLTLMGAKCFITVSPPLSEAMGKLHYQHAFTIENGYPESPDVPLTKAFTMTYTGNFYAGKYDIEMFCWTLSNYRYMFPSLLVRIYGQPYPPLVKLVEAYSLTDTVKFYPRVSHFEALKAQKESHVLLHFAWNDHDYQGVYSAKLFEYLGAKRPIISFGGKDSMVGDLLENTCTGAWCETPHQFGLAMGHYQRQYEQNGSPSYHGKEISAYSQERMAQRHAELFDRIVK